MAIFRAHKATPIVIATEGETRFPADVTIAVPAVDPALGFVLSAMVGHLFGYEAALAIDASARPLREAREVDRTARRRGLDAATRSSSGSTPICVRPPSGSTTGCAAALYDGHLEASTATRLSGLLRDMLSDRPLEQYQLAVRQGRHAAAR